MFANIKTTVSEKLTHTKRCCYSAYAAFATSMMIMTPTLCAPDMRTIFNQFMNIIYDIALFVGAVITVMGAFNWIMAQKDENADGQSRAIKFVVVGITLVCFKAFAQPIITSIFS